MAAGAIVITVASLAMANWVFGVGVFEMQVLNQPGQAGRADSAMGITPDAAFCFILCGISLWVLRESAGKAAPRKAPTEKFLVEAALNRASLVKLFEEDSDETEPGKSAKKSPARKYVRRAAQLCASVVAAIAVVVLTGYALGWDAGFGGWLARTGAAFGQGNGAESVSAQMAPSVAFAFLLNGVALATLDAETNRGTRPAQYLALTTLALSLVVALGRVYQTSPPYDFFAARGWPEMTAIVAFILIALSIGIVCARPRSGVISLLTSESSGGYVARRLLPAAIVVPAALGGLMLLGERAGYFKASRGVWLLVLANILFFLILIWRGAVSLHNVDTDRLLAESSLYNAYSDLQKRVGEQASELSRANQDLWAEMIERDRVEEEWRQGQDELADFLGNAPVGVHKVGPDGVILWANDAELGLMGYTREEYVGHHISEFHADQSVLEEMLRRLWQGENLDNYEARLRTKDGSIRHALISSNVLWRDGNFIHTRCFTSDITEGKRAQEALLESERRARLQMWQLDVIYHSSPIGLALVGANLRYLRANEIMGEMMAQISGLPSDEIAGGIIGRSVREAMPALADLVEAHFRHVLGSGAPLLDVELRAPLRKPMSKEMDGCSGAERDLLISYYPLKDFDGMVLGVNVTALDITERKQAESRLRESEAKFRLMADSAPVMIWMSGADKVCNFFNKGWLDFTGRTIEQEMENGWAEGIHPEDFDHCLETYVEAFNDRCEFKVEYRLRRHDGQYRWILNHGVPRFNLNGTLGGYIGSCMDIHERKEAEEALRSIEEFSRGILESSADCIEALDLDGRLISMNKTGMNSMEIEDFSGYVGAVWTELFESGERAAAHDAVETAKAGGVGHFIGSLKTKKGALKWWDVIVSPVLDRRGQPECLMAISRDITEARQMERERDELLSREQAARGQAEDANRLKDEFLATVSHELRAPLNAIQGWVKLLRDGRLKPDEASRALETIERSTRAQNRIISDLLDVSRIITGKLRLNVRPINPANVIESAVEALRPAADAKEIGIEVIADDSAGPISGDSDRLRQIVWNLVSNAIKFTPKQGRVQVRLNRAGSNVEIIVSDTGAGIDPDFLPFVFDRFRQGDSSSTRRQGGLGLGLAIVRHLTEMHGGSVRAESQGLDQGATFVVKLPLIAQNQLKDNVRMHSVAAATGSAGVGGKAGFNAATMDQAPELDGLRVLAVDDDSDARDLIRTILTQCGAIVETASSTNQALAVFERPEEWQPELLISDIEMPEADGYQLIGKLREIESQRGRRIPAIALTAYARAEDRLRSLSAGFQMHVTKPVEPAELLTIVASLTGRLSKTRGLYQVSDAVRQEARNC